MGRKIEIVYGVKMLVKKGVKILQLQKLEGLWWVDSDKSYTKVPREEWRWKLLIRQSEFVISEIVDKARQEVIKKKKLELANEVKFERIKEGKCLQILHIGPYSKEPKSIAKMRKLMEEKNLMPNGPIMKSILL